MLVYTQIYQLYNHLQPHFKKIHNHNIFSRQVYAINYIRDHLSYKFNIYMSTLGNGTCKELQLASH